MNKETDKKIDFAVGLKELEDITAWFESDEIDLDEALSKFERGMELASQLKSHLGVIENKVETIKQKFTTPIAGNKLEAEEPVTGSSEPDLFSQPPAA
jgi:exodeoxyribonuclease VII small subunit